jgi:hypothetical protein
MKKSLRILIALSIAASSIIYIQPASAVDGFDSENRLMATSLGSCWTSWLPEISWKLLVNSNSQITKVQLQMLDNRTPTRGLELYSDLDGDVGSLIGSFNYNSARGVSSSGIATFDATTPLTVSSGNVYWLKVNSDHICVPFSPATFYESGLSINLSSGQSILRYFGGYLTQSINMAFFGSPLTSAPTVPTAVVATATGKTSATVSFAAPASNGGSAVTSYTATSSPGGITKTLQQSAGGTFTFDGLQASTAYSFAVTATNAIGTSSATNSNLVNTLALEVASFSALTFQDDGTGTAGKIIWAGMNIDAVLYTGPEAYYPGPFNYGTFTGGWNGRIRNLTPDTTYTVTITAISADGVGGNRSLTFKTNAALPVIIGAASSTTAQSDATKLEQLLNWVDENTYVTGEATNMSGLLTDFAALKTSPSSTKIKVPLSSVSTVVATSLTPNSCSVVSTTADVNAGEITALTTDKCTISYTVTGGSGAPATFVRDFVFTYFELKCGAGTYKLKAGVVSSGGSCTGAVTIDATATSIAYFAFEGSLMTSVTLPNSIIMIANYAFLKSRALTSVVLGNAISRIGIAAFAYTGITSISLPDSLRTLDRKAFVEMPLTSLIIPVGTKTIDEYLTANSPALSIVTVPNTVTSAGLYAFVNGGVKTVNYCGNNGSVLSAIRQQGISPTCVAPALAPVTSSNSNP